MTTFDTDPNTQTVAAAWASSELGQPEREARYGFAPETVTETDGAKPVAKHAVLAAAVGCGIAGGAALALMLFDSTPAGQTVVVPGAGTSPQHAVVVSESGQAPPPKPVEPARAPAPAAVAPTPAAVAPTPAKGPSTPGVGTPPTHLGDNTVVVDIPIPDYPPLPEMPEDDAEEPEPPAPDPPVLDDPAFELPELPEPDPDPDPPTFLPDLPLAPLPDPDPALELPLAPSVELNPQPEPPSFGPTLPDFSPDFSPPAGFRS